MTGKTFADLNSSSMGQPTSASSGSSPRSLTDPLLQDVDIASREYLIYFTSHVCKDLVLYDTAKHNPLRGLVPMSGHYEGLQQIIVAASALHMSNAYRSFSPTQGCVAYQDALAAKQRALSSLKTCVTTVSPADTDVTLATVLLFIEFELIDSGRDNWRHHVDGARAIIQKLCGSAATNLRDASPLRNCLVANCLVYGIIGSTLASPIELGPKTAQAEDIQSLIRDADGNHCSSMPIPLLQVLESGAALYRSKEASTTANAQQLKALLDAARAFDPELWAAEVQSRSPICDLHYRFCVAAAHKAAVTIYISRVLMSACPSIESDTDTEALVTVISDRLEAIRPGNALFKATVWPTFIAGAETNETQRQRWVAQRFRELWDVEPWGLLRGASSLLAEIWEMRGRSKMYIGEACDRSVDWIGLLRDRGVDWLIL